MRKKLTVDLTLSAITDQITSMGEEAIAIARNRAHYVTKAITCLRMIKELDAEARETGTGEIFSDDLFQTLNNYFDWEAVLFEGWANELEGRVVILPAGSDLLTTFEEQVAALLPWKKKMDETIKEADSFKKTAKEHLQAIEQEAAQIKDEALRERILYMVHEVFYS